MRQLIEKEKAKRKLMNDQIFGINADIDTVYAQIFEVEIASMKGTKLKTVEKLQIVKNNKEDPASNITVCLAYPDNKIFMEDQSNEFFRGAISRSESIEELLTCDKYSKTVHTEGTAKTTSNVEFYVDGKPGDLRYIIGLYNPSGRTFFISNEKSLDLARSMFVKYLDGESIEWADNTAKNKVYYTTTYIVDPAENGPFNIDTNNVAEYLETDDEFIDLDDNGRVIGYYNSTLRLGMIATDASCKDGNGEYQELTNRTLFVAKDEDTFMVRYNKFKNSTPSPAINNDVIISYTVDTSGNILSTIGVPSRYEKKTEYYNIVMEYKKIGVNLIIESMNLDICGYNVLEAVGHISTEDKHLISSGFYSLTNCVTTDDVVIGFAGGFMTSYTDSKVTVSNNEFVSFAYTPSDYFIRDQFGIPVHIIAK